MKMQRIMIKNVKVLVLALLLAAASCSFTTSDEDPGKDKVLVSLISYVLEKGHYDAKEFNDAFSEEVFDDFVTSLPFSNDICCISSIPFWFCIHNVHVLLSCDDATDAMI